MPTRDFCGSVTEALRVVNEAAGQSAILVYVEGKTKDGKPTENTKNVSVLSALFRTEPGYATIATLPDTWREWGKPKLCNGHWTGPASIEWPAEVNYDLSEAYEKIVLERHGSSFTGIKLIKWLYPGIEEPYYYFTDSDGYYFGTATGKVYLPHE